MKNRDDWTVADSTLFAHFVQVVDRLNKSRWRATSPKISWSAGAVTRCEVADAEATICAIVYIRQLYSDSKRDNLIRGVSKRYGHFTESSEKLAEARKIRARLESSLKSPAIPLIELTGFSPVDLPAQRVLEAVAYGAGVLHGRPTEQGQQKQDFEYLQFNCSRQATLHAFHWAMIQVANSGNQLMGLVYPDFHRWFNEHNLPRPEVPWHDSLFDSGLKPFLGDDA